jgi:hypothetical protein
VRSDKKQNPITVHLDKIQLANEHNIDFNEFDREPFYGFPTKLEQPFPPGPTKIQPQIPPPQIHLDQQASDPCETIPKVIDSEDSGGNIEETMHSSIRRVVESHSDPLDHETVTPSSIDRREQRLARTHPYNLRSKKIDMCQYISETPCTILKDVCLSISNVSEIPLVCKETLYSKFSLDQNSSFSTISSLPNNISGANLKSCLKKSSSYGQNNKSASFVSGFLKTKFENESQNLFKEELGKRSYSLENCLEEEEEENNSEDFAFAVPLLFESDSVSDSQNSLTDFTMPGSKGRGRGRRQKKEESPAKPGQS